MPQISVCGGGDEVHDARRCDDWQRAPARNPRADGRRFRPASLGIPTTGWTEAPGPTGWRNSVNRMARCGIGDNGAPYPSRSLTRQRNNGRSQVDRRVAESALRAHIGRSRWFGDGQRTPRSWRSSAITGTAVERGLATQAHTTVTQEQDHGVVFGSDVWAPHDRARAEWATNRWVPHVGTPAWLLGRAEERRG
jgi:hypothetical protein